MKHMIKITKVTCSILENVIDKFKMNSISNYEGTSDFLKQMVTTHDNSITFLTIDVSTSRAYFFVGVPNLEDKVYHNVHEFRDFVRNYNRLTNIADPLVETGHGFPTSHLKPQANVAAVRPKPIGVTHRYENETYGEIFNFSIGKDSNFVFLAGEWLELKGELPFELTPIETEEERQARLRKEELFVRVEKAFFDLHGASVTSKEYDHLNKSLRAAFEVTQEQDNE